MFSFTLSHKFRARGVSSDLILPAARDRFDALFNDGFLDRRLQVRFSQKAIHFLFYQDEMNEPLIEKEYKEIASISLTAPKETEHDILYLANQCEKKCKAIEWKKCIIKNNWIRSLENAVRSLVGSDREKDEKVTRFTHFPFIEKWKWTEIDHQKWFVFFFQCCFLYFILDIEDRDSDFSKSPVYEHVRGKLRESMVYRVLCAKIQYALYHFEGGKHQSKDEFSFKTRTYADLLMDKKMNEIIPRSYFYESLWFHNPEAELGFIVGENASVKKELQMDDHLLGRIRDFFFQKHAVFRAMRTTPRKWHVWIYVAYLVIITVFSIVATCCLLHFDREPQLVVGFFFKHIVFWFYLCVGSLLILLLLAVVSKSLNVFMPRVLVALSIGWLTAFISEDLIKSQIEIGFHFTAIACVCVLLLIALLLFGEAKQHSPYYLSMSGLARLVNRETNVNWIKKRWLNFRAFFKWLCISVRPSSWKIMPVFVHSYFWAITMGVLMQFALYEGLLEKSEALSEIVYDQVFDDAENYIMHLSNFKESLTSYRQDLDGVFRTAAVSGVVKGAKTIDFISAEPFFGPNFKSSCKTKVARISSKMDSIGVAVIRIDSHGDVIEDLLDSLSFKTVTYREIEKKVDSLCVYVNLINTTGSSVGFEDNVNQQLHCLDRIIAAVEEDIQSMSQFISENDNYQELISWSDHDVVSLPKAPYSMESVLIRNAKQHYLCRKVRMFWIKKDEEQGTLIKLRNDIRLFPRMLIFHALIVLIISFVGQLIVSDKTVTEPL